MPFKNYFNSFALVTTGFDFDFKNKVMFFLIPIQGVFIIVNLMNLDYFAKIPVLFFFLMIVIHYSYMFACFSKNGFRLQMIKFFGEEKGYEMNRIILNISFYMYSYALLGICVVSPTDQTSFIHYPLFKIIGVCFFIIGILVKFNTVLHAGFSAFYLKDLFLGKKTSEFTNQGIYKYFKNPMYGIGYIHGYGAAIYKGSLLGIAAVLGAQILINLFFYRVELPHIKENILPLSGLNIVAPSKKIC